MRIKNLKSLLISIITFSSLTTFANVDDDLVELGNNFSVNVDGQLTSISSFFENNTSIATTDLQESSISLSASWKQQIRAVISANIAQLIANNELVFNDNFDIESFGPFFSRAFGYYQNFWTW